MTKYIIKNKIHLGHVTDSQSSLSFLWTACGIFLGTMRTPFETSERKDIIVVMREAERVNCKSCLKTLKWKKAMGNRMVERMNV